MRLIEGALYLDLSEAVEAGIGSERYLWKAKSIGTKCYDFIKDPSDSRCVLLAYDTLKDEHRAKVEGRFGNPYDLVARQPILNMVKADPKAHGFFFGYTYDHNSKPSYLTPRQVAQSTRSAAWLALITKLNDNAGWREIKEAIGLKRIPEFFTHASALIALEIANGKSETYASGPRQLPGNFPSTYQRLKEKAAAFAAQGYEHCLPLGLGNKMASKIGKTETGYDPAREAEQMAVIRYVASKHNNFDAAQIAQFAQQLFIAKGWEMVSVRRIRQILDADMATLTPGRRGKKAYNNTVAMQVKRTAPQWPTSFFTIDGWTAELLYQKEGKHHHRLDIVIVLDPTGKYPVGYAIGEQENPELIRRATRNAILHLRELFGDYYRPAQLQSDNYAKKQLTPFFQAVAQLHTPAAVGNAKSKVIEPYFKYLNKTYCQTQPNWAGFGVTATAKNQVNREMVHMMRHQIPDLEGCVRQIEAMIATERAKKVDAYLQAWAEMPAELKLRMDYLGLEWLQVFGKALGRTNSLTGQGIVKQVAGCEYTYDSFDPIFRREITTDWQLIGDPEDLSRVLAVSPDEKLRFVLQEKMLPPMDARSTTAEHHAYLSQVRGFNKTEETRITDTYGSDASTVQRLLENTQGQLDKDAEAVLRLMPIYGGQQKEIMQVAKGQRKAKERHDKALSAVQENNWQAMQQQYLNSQTDYSKYLDQ